MTSEEKRRRTWGFSIQDVSQRDLEQLVQGGEPNKPTKIKSIAYRYNKSNNSIKGIARMINPSTASQMQTKLKMGYGTLMVDVFEDVDDWRQGIKAYENKPDCVVMQDLAIINGAVPKVIIPPKLNEPQMEPKKDNKDSNTMTSKEAKAIGDAADAKFCNNTTVAIDEYLDDIEKLSLDDLIIKERYMFDDSIMGMFLKVMVQSRIRELTKPKKDKLFS